jgi:hypothetical protein
MQYRLPHRVSFDSALPDQQPAAHPRGFRCPFCRQRLSFEQRECPNCGEELLFDATKLKFVGRENGPSCGNRQIIGCNWSVESGCQYCSSCSLNRTIPNLSFPRNVLLWRRVEEAKRRLIHDLRRLRLPLISRSGATIAFDILSEEAGPVLTGHLSGLITLNIVEADDVERESRRTAFREPYRTLLGHFRHEVGHFYWAVLVQGTRLQAPFDLIFGDAAQDYQEALRNYYLRTERAFDRGGFISEYATSHPWEDWAETFAHFLHIVSTLDTMAGLPLALDERARRVLQDPYLENDFDALLACWKPVAYSINELNRSLGLNDAYPFELTSAIIGKLHLVHMALEHFRHPAVS